MTHAEDLFIKEARINCLILAGRLAEIDKLSVLEIAWCIELMKSLPEDFKRCIAILEDRKVENKL